MKVLLLILPLIVGAYSMLSDIPFNLTNLIEENENSTKYNILTQYVAMAWGYGNFIFYSAGEYLEDLADYILEDYNLTIQQKVNSIKVRYILAIFDKTIRNRKYIRTAKRYAGKYKLDSHKLQMINEFTLAEGELAMDLLVQSCAPPNLTPIHYIEEDLPNDELEVEDVITARKIAAGTLLLVNNLLDPQYRLNIPLETALDMSPTELKRLLENHAYKNFEVYKPESNKPAPDYVYF